MQCINKRKAGYHKSGKGIAWRSKDSVPELASFEIECRKCLPCRLNTAREKSIRSLHEASCHKDNIFLTLTYNEENLKSPWLQYIDFQLFMKSLRELHTRNITDPELKKKMSISFMVTGEYGEKNKRPHWHALIFNYRPSDERPIRDTPLGHRVYTSKTLSDLWGKGNIEYGEITIDSASYTARYAAKKLVHGKDGDHDYHPIHKTSSAHAIGKRWIEKHWKQTFELGFVYLPNGSKTRIPRYYTEWLKKHQPEAWRTYIMTLRQKIQEEAQRRADQEEITYLTELLNTPNGWPRPITAVKAKLTILNQKFKILQGKLKI